MTVTDPAPLPRQPALLADLGPLAQLRAGRLGRRLWQLAVGLVLYGVSLALMVLGGIGLAPWDFAAARLIVSEAGGMVTRADGSITAGNASGINDGACALLIASETAVQQHSLAPKARIVGMAVAGLAPRIMGYGPVAAVQKVLAQTGLTLAQMDVIELNEAFAAQALAVMRALGLPDDAAHVNPNGGAIALGHPLGASGARLAATALYQLQRSGGRYALCSMCIGVGQGIALIIERVS